MSTGNQGRWLQDLVTTICEDYDRRRLAKIHKVDPPMKIVGTGYARKTIFMPNPFVDYIGAWEVRAGRAIALEAKSTADPSLALCQSCGVTDKQWLALNGWRRAGAAVGILWGYRDEIRFVPFEAARAQLTTGVKHVKWEHATPVPRGLGMCVFDFLHTLAEYHPQK